LRALGGNDRAPLVREERGMRQTKLLQLLWPEASRR